MATAPAPTNRPRRQARPPKPLPRWRRWLLLGLLFGLGHGLTQRLLEMPWGEDSSRAPAFRPKPPSGGPSLEDLRKRHAAAKNQPLTADLEALGRQKREEQQKLEAAKREQAERQKAALREEKERLERDRRQLESFDSGTDTPTPEPLRQEPKAPPTPSAPELPPPDPFALESPAPPTPPAGEPEGAPSLP
ncbi:MAG: hypothetical protein VKP70_03460 [Cyanobacteriota bacterium]|nr:hypothetical protein [Cyanobacteriota bacterium]